MAWPPFIILFVIIYSAKSLPLLFNFYTLYLPFDLDNMDNKEKITRDWLKRYTGTSPGEYGEWILLTNFQNYVEKFSEKFNVPVNGIGGPMTSATNEKELSIINFGIGSANAATIMDLLACIKPKGVLFLGKCGGLKKTTELGHFILPTAAIRGEGTSDDYFPKEVPAMPSFKLHKHVSQVLVERELEYRTGVIYTTNRRVWEHDEEFKNYLKRVRAMGIDMETATIFITGFANGIDRGALLMVSDTPMVPEGVKTEESDKEVTRKYVNLHIEIGIEAMTRIGGEGEKIKHFTY